MHTAGERVFVDFAGHTMEVIDGATGEIQRVEVFVAVLGASSYVFAQATWTQSLPDWIAAHVNMLASIGGVPRQIVSDNLRAGITRACFYEPLVNRTYADMASHYGTAVIPARPYKPRDNAVAKSVTRARSSGNMSILASVLTQGLDKTMQIAVLGWARWRC